MGIGGPREVDQLSLWEFGVLQRGHNARHGGAKASAPSSAEHRERMKRHG